MSARTAALRVIVFVNGSSSSVNTEVLPVIQHALTHFDWTLRPLRWVTVASPAYLARCGAPGDVASLQDHACLAVRNLRSGRLVDWQFLQANIKLNSALNRNHMSWEIR